ncbi:hypothetical protein L596_028035 [Steinernema carpocapsae]|uniref:Uncharacterized protein n=1 Tax=Steinernema carpocapsae TaxID=34508 RepID=A0A4U5LX99_STECR|nr:hypothetical protein L596_028035 [Steinernema carpocapsae]
MLEEYGHTTQVLQLGQSALTSELSEPLMQEIFTILFRTQINIKDYAAALMTLRRNPIREKKMFALRDLLGQLIVQNQWKTLLDLDYLDVNPNVLLYLKGRAEGSDVGYAGQLYNIAGGCYYKAKLFRKAAKLYYELATRLIPLCTNIDALSRRAEALLICHSTLKLESDEDLQWIERIDRPEVNIQSDESMANEEAAEAQKAEIHIYNLEDIRNEWFLETMRLRIANKDDPNFRHGAPSTEPRLIVAELVRLKQYDYAWRVIGKFKVDPSDFFQAVTIDCIKSDLRRDKSRFPMWVYRNMEFCWHSKEPINKHWKILETYLNQYEVEDNVGDPRMKRTILYTILTHAATIPEWLKEIQDGRLRRLSALPSRLRRHHRVLGVLQEVFRISENRAQRPSKAQWPRTAHKHVRRPTRVSQGRRNLRERDRRVPKGPRINLQHNRYDRTGGYATSRTSLSGGCLSFVVVYCMFLLSFFHVIYHIDK